MWVLTHVKPVRFETYHLMCLVKAIARLELKKGLIFKNHQHVIQLFELR